MARDAIGIASNTAQQRDEDDNPVVTGIGGNAAENYAATRGVTNGVTKGTNGTSARREYKPDSYIPVEEHVLLHPTQETKVISIGCGFSGMEIRRSEHRAMFADADICQA
jgi:hypothetical protein